MKAWTTPRVPHEEVLYRLRLAQARLKGVQARSAKAAIKRVIAGLFRLD